MQSMAELPERAGVALDAKLADQRALAQIARTLDELPHDLRVAYVMCVIEDISSEESARALSVPRGTLWRRIHEARQALRAAVEREEPR